MSHLALVCVAGFSLGQIATDNARLQKICRMHRATRESIERFYVQGRCEAAGPVEREIVFFWARQGNRYRYQTRTRLTGGGPSGPKLLFQDEYGDEHVRRSLIIQGTDRLPVCISDTQHEAFRAAVEPRATSRAWANPEVAAMLSISLRSAPLSRGVHLEQLLDKANDVQWAQQEDGKIRIQLQVAAAPDRPEGKEQFILWLEPRAGFLICRIETTYQDPSQSWRSVSYAREFYNRNGVYWPKEVVSQLTHNNVSLGTVKWIFERVFLNEPLPEECFDFRFPQGALVVETQGSSKLTRVYLYGENNQVARSFSPEEFQEYLHRKRGLPPGPQPPQKPALWPVVATLGLLVLAGGLALWWRRAARRG